MNIWDKFIDFIFPPNTWFTAIYECEDETGYFDGKRWINPSLIRVTWQARHKLGEPIHDAKYRFRKMVIIGTLVDAPEVVITHTIDKIEKVPVRFLECLDRNYGKKADI